MQKPNGFLHCFFIKIDVQTPAHRIDKAILLAYRQCMPSGVFSILPENFFSPLAAQNRQHYAALLVLYYRLFQENTHGLEREFVIREFMGYLAIHRDSLAEEAEEMPEDKTSGDRVSEDKTNVSAYAEETSAIQEFNFNNGDVPESDKITKKITNDTRDAASRFLRRLINAGWLSEETLADFTRIINITAWGKPFLEALIRIDEGLKTEYESHVVNVYSSLCGETVKENGHFMVLKAREEARALIDSLKVLSQSIKGYYDKLNAEAIRSKAASVLHEHYNLYAGEVLDRAYKRLKTSDNVSRYRQSIFKQIKELLNNDEWLDASASKYLRILPERSSANTREECREKLISMLEEIRDDLKSVDPLEDIIDRRNADYSRSSTEIIRAYIEPDSTVAGKIGMIIKAMYAPEYKNNGGEKLYNRLSHGLHRIQFLSPSTLTLRRSREEGDFTNQPAQADTKALDGVETEFLDRMKKRLSIKKISTWLDEQGGTNRILFPKELVKDETSYIHFIYSLLYGDSRNNFDYMIEETKNNDGVKADNYIVPDVRLRRKNESRP
jgi:hypothetical protein